MKITLVRCGQTEENYSEIVVGKGNPLLNETGRRQVLRLKNKLAKTVFDKCFVSPQIRCFETAIVLVGDKCEIVRENRLIERDMGNFENKEKENYNAFNYWNYDKNISLNGVEPIKDLIERCSKFVDYILNKDYESIIIVIDEEVYRALRHLLRKDILKGNLLDGKIDNCIFEEFNV